MMGAKTATKKRSNTMTAPTTARPFRLNRPQKMALNFDLSLSTGYLALILGSATMYPTSASRFPKRVNSAPIVRMPITVG